MNYFNKPPTIASAFGQNESIADKAKGFFSGYMFLLVAVLVVFVIIVIYYKTIGYYVQVGWKNIRRMMGFGTEVEVSVGPGDEQGAQDSGVIATIAPMAGPEMAGPGDAPPASSMLPPDERPMGMPGASSSSSSSLFGDVSIMPHRDEVFNVSRNVYTFHDAAAVCAAVGAELASYDQVKEAYDKGADWCNYGWIKGQMAVYPTQKETYEKLQKGSSEFRNACGVPGVNGGHFDNPELRFGVNCYGKKPVKKASDELIESQVALPASPEQIEFDKQVQKFREQMDATTILPFSKGRWTA